MLCHFGKNSRQGTTDLLLHPSDPFPMFRNCEVKAGLFPDHSSITWPNRPSSLCQSGERGCAGRRFSVRTFVVATSYCCRIAEEAGGLDVYTFLHLVPRLQQQQAFCFIKGSSSSSSQWSSPRGIDNSTREPNLHARLIRGT